MPDKLFTPIILGFQLFVLLLWLCIGGYAPSKHPESPIYICNMLRAAFWKIAPASNVTYPLLDIPSDKSGILTCVN